MCVSRFIRSRWDPASERNVVTRLRSLRSRNRSSSPSRGNEFFISAKWVFCFINTWKVFPCVEASGA